MEKGEESLSKAFQLQQKQHGSTPTVSKSVDEEDTGWQAVIDDFIAPTWQKEFGCAPEAG